MALLVGKHWLAQAPGSITTCPDSSPRILWPYTLQECTNSEWMTGIWSPLFQNSREGNGNPLQCSCLENPRDGGAWWAAIYGVTQSRTRLKWLSSNSSSSRTHWAYQVVLVVKNLPANEGDVRDAVSIPGSERSLGGGYSTLSCILVWRIPWTEEPGGLWVAHDWSDLVHSYRRHRRCGFDPMVGTIAWIENGNSLYYCLENIMDRGICQATIHKESDATEHAYSKT